MYYTNTILSNRLSSPNLQTHSNKTVCAPQALQSGKNEAISFSAICISARHMGDNMEISASVLSAAHTHTVPRQTCTAAGLRSHRAAG